MGSPEEIFLKFFATGFLVPFMAPMLRLRVFGRGVMAFSRAAVVGLGCGAYASTVRRIVYESSFSML
jgi:hypothetical protein